MPNETAFAWRYGIDRYDLKITDNYLDFIDLIKNGNISFDHLHTFYYTKNGLINTTDEMRKLLQSKSFLQKVDFTTDNINDELKINLKTPITSLTPIKIDLTLSGNPPDISKINFPYIHDSSFAGNTIAINTDKRVEAFDYLKVKNNLMKNSKITSSSEWLTDTTNRVLDNNMQTNWRANRLLWGKENTNLILDIGRTYKIGEFVWINGFGNSTPTRYSLDISIDGKNWKNVSAVTNTKRIDSKDPQVITFEAQNTRYIRVNFLETLDSDAPQISEVWVVPSEFSDLNIKETEEFLSNPFGYVGNSASFASTLRNLNYKGEILINGVTHENLFYDGITRTYSFTIPAGGITISQLTIKNLQIPGNVLVKSISYRNLSLDEIEK